MNKDKLSKVEPTAEIREMASAIAQLYAALRQEGFSDSQAIRLVGEIMGNHD